MLNLIFSIILLRPAILPDKGPSIIPIQILANTSSRLQETQTVEIKDKKIDVRLLEASEELVVAEWKANDEPEAWQMIGTITVWNRYRYDDEWGLRLYDGELSRKDWLCQRWIRRSMYWF